MSLPFSPYYNATVILSGTTTTSNAAITATCNALRIVNIGTVATFINLGTDNTVAATNNDFVVGPNESVVISKGANYSYIAALTASGTATVYVTPVTAGN
jgi:hypothetical protein